jgi:N-carbamoylputrescine amidase
VPDGTQAPAECIIGKVSELRISFLHLAPVTGDIEHNRRLLESAVKVAAKEGAGWAITPELWVSGYLFMEQIGTDWILPQPDEWMRGFCWLVRELGLTVFLSHPERDRESGTLYNSVFVIDRLGKIVGKHRKIRPLRGAEAWSSPGGEINPVDVDRQKVGILICADSYRNDVAQELKEKGAQVLVSPVSWGPGPCAPDGEWEQRTIDTGLPIMVCNRSGIEGESLDFRQAESIVAQHGRRLLTGTCDRSVVLSFDWDTDAMALLSTDFRRAYLEEKPGVLLR